MSAFTFAAFLAEITLGWALAHPAASFLFMGVTGVSGVLATAAAIMRRDDMPLGRDDQETVDLFAAMPREVPVHHEPRRHTPRHARPRPPVPAPALVAARAATSTLALLPAPEDVPGREPATRMHPGSPPTAREGRGAGPAGDTADSIWPHDTGWYSAAAIEAAVTAGEARR